MTWNALRNQPRAIALVFLGATLLHAQAARGLIRGRVLADETGDPIRDARVSLAEGADSTTVLSGEDGRFTLPVPADRRAISAVKTGYAKATSVASDGVEIRLVKGGAISGHVVDDFGEPLPLRILSAQHLIRANGRVGLESAAIAESDDKGDYRLFGLPAGEFVVAVVGGRTFSNTGAPILTGRGQPPHNYYPNAERPSEARIIMVGPGDEVPGIDLTIALPPAAVRPRETAPPVRPGVTGTIQGRVARSDGLPMRGAQVQLSSADNLFSPYTTTADDDGRYEFPGLRAGSYLVGAATLSAQTVKFGQHADRGDAVVVAAGAVVDHVDITVPQGSAIAGRVLDENGDPVAHAGVRAMQARWVAGRRRLVIVPDSIVRWTDDLGRYRLFRLWPGQYLITAVAGQAGASLGLPETATLPGYARTFFPATLVAREGQTIEVAADQDALNADITLVRGHTARIAGRAFTAAGAPVQGVVWLSTSYRSGAIESPPVSARTRPDGAFEFKDLPPGEYVLQAARSRIDRSTEGEFAAQFVTLNGTDAANIAMRMTAGSTITGRVTFEGADPPDPGDLELSPVVIDQDLISLANDPVARAQIHDDWTFEMGGVSGPRLLRLVSGPEEWALKTVLVNGLESTDTPLPFGTKEESLRDVEVVFTRRISGVSGVVANAEGRPAAGRAVIVFAADRAEWHPQSRFLGHALSARDGTFDLHPLPPGSYHVAAIEPPQGFEENRDFENPKLLESLVAGATRVTLAEGQRASVIVKLREGIRD